jgi:hypothetical protein
VPMLGFASLHISMHGRIPGEGTVADPIDRDAIPLVMEDAVVSVMVVDDVNRDIENRGNLFFFLFLTPTEVDIDGATDI